MKTNNYSRKSIAAFVSLIAIAAVSFMFFSCSKSGRAKKSAREPAGGVVQSARLSKSKSFASEALFEADSMQVNYDTAEAYEAESVGNMNTGSDDNAQVERKLIKTGDISVEVQALSGIEVQAEQFAKNFGGYITNSSLSERNFYCTVKVPCGRFDDAMKAAGDFGRLLNRSENSRDVTDEFYDLESRINTKRILKNKLEGYLSSAKDIKDLLQIEKQLNSTISDLESMEGKMKRLSNQIDFSTINLSAELPTGKTETGFDWPDLGEDFREFLTNTASFFAGFLLLLFYLAVYGIPIVALIAFLFWLLFGRLGLLIKLFKWLKWK